MLVDVLLEREKMKREESNVFKYYWKVFYQRVSLHRARCDEVTCVCRGRVRKAVGKNESSKNKQGKAKDPGRRKD